MSLPEYSTQPPRPTTEVIQESRPTANRYYTEVYVEVYEEGNLRRLMWFSDLQLAHIWCMDQVKSHPDEHWDVLHSSFVEFADAMDRRWRQIQQGKSVARSYNYEWILHYEP